MRTRLLTAALVAAAFLAVVPVGLAHEGHAHRYMGTIESASDSQLSLKTTDGQTITFKLDATTKITKGKVPGGAKDLAPGARAVVEAEGGKEPLLAKSIKLAAAKSTT